MHHPQDLRYLPETTGVKLVNEMKYFTTEIFKATGQIHLFYF